MDWMLGADKYPVGPGDNVSRLDYPLNAVPVLGELPPHDRQDGYASG
jgi:hypothetical protein